MDDEALLAQSDIENNLGERGREGGGGVTLKVPGWTAEISGAHAGEVGLSLRLGNVTENGLVLAHLLHTQSLKVQSSKFNPLHTL
jgi:hypothetical protein